MSFEDVLWICVPGVTPPAPRPRARVGGTTSTGKRIASVYTPSTGPFGQWKKAAGPYMRIALRAFPSQGPNPFEGHALEVRLMFVAPMPVGNHRIRLPTLRQWCRSLLRGDSDNIAKGPLDAGNQIIWRDDRDIARLVVEHVVGEQGEPARCEIMVRRLEPGSACRTEFEEIRERLRLAGQLWRDNTQAEMSWQPDQPQKSLVLGGG